MMRCLISSFTIMAPSKTGITASDVAVTVLMDSAQTTVVDSMITDKTARGAGLIIQNIGKGSHHVHAEEGKLMEIDGKKYPGLEVWKKPGDDGQYHLMMLINARSHKELDDQDPRFRGWWSIPVTSKGEPTKAGTEFDDCYGVPWKKLPLCAREKIKKAVLRIQRHGPPMKNAFKGKHGGKTKGVQSKALS